MNTSLSKTLLDTLEYLMTLSRDKLQPEEAQQLLRPIQQYHSDTPIRLLWEEVAYDQSLHYDALLQLDGNGTFSLSYCNDNGLPWPMRGAHHWGEKDLVRVNNTVLQVDQALAYLEFIWDEVRIINRLVNVCLIRDLLASEPIDLSDEDLQKAIDTFRRAHSLNLAEDTHHWLQQHGMTHDQLERLVSQNATMAKLRKQVTAQSIQEYFLTHRAAFDQVHIACISLSDKEIALHTMKQLNDNELDFYEAAERCFLKSASSEQGARNLFSVVQRGQERSRYTDNIFVAEPGEILGPFPTGDAFLIVRVLSSSPANLDESVRCKIEDILFEEWLAERRQGATIEWYWGNSSRTSEVHSQRL